MDLAKIIERYSKAYPRHARGGLSALAGFDFQIRSYLADFVSALVEPRDLEAAGNELTHRLETLSDYLRQEAEQTVVVQAKRTLDGKTLKEAALEFARLDAFFEREGNGERFATLRFELVAQRGEPLDWDAVGKLGGDGVKAIEIAKRFEQLRHDGRLLPVRIAPDPWWRLLAKIYPLLDDPFAFAREALDACLGIGLDLDGPARVRLQIAELFARRRRREGPALPGILLTSEDVAFAPRTHEVIVGQVPTLAHLRDGRFVDRQERVAACVAALEAMLISRTPEIEAVLDTFWIDGRSGCGKSVLLLQLVRHLVEVMGQPVIWLANRSEELVPLLERWPALAGGFELPVFVAIDDLYDRHGRQALDLHRLGSLVREAPEVAWPVLLTCGPPEFHEALKRDARGEGIRLHPWRLPPLTTDEAVAVRHWFKERTGTRGAGGNTGQPEPETLMVSLLFELRYGDLLSFASRFAERLALGGLDELLILPLALNRLYIWAPRAWLGEEGIDRLDALNRDADFAVLRAEEVTGGSLKLTHPHLSDALYQVLRKHPSPQAFTRDLARAFAKALDSAPMVASRILQVLGDGSERLAILDATTLVREVVAVWRAREGAEEVFTPDWRLMVWLNWARWAAHQPEVGAALGSPTPFERCRRALAGQPNHPAWGSVWQLLHALEPGSTELNELALDWLVVDVRGRWERPDWSFIWQTLVEGPGVTPEVSERLLRLGWQWLAGREDRSDWNFVWQSLMKQRAVLPVPITIEGLIETGMRWIAARPDRPGWAHVWKRLLELRELFDDPKEAGRLLDRGRRWLDDREDRSEWTHVWQHLLELRELFDDPNEAGRLLDRGRRWLDDREDRNEWNYVWKRLLDLRELFDDPNEVGRLLDRGRRWLDGREDRNEWTFVWQKLFDHRREPALAAAGLAELGWEWLQQPAHRERGEWDKIYEAILETGYQAKDFLRAGAAWCQQHQKEPQTPPLAAKILAATSWAQEFDSLAGWLASWLQSHPQARQNRAVHWIFRKVLRKAEPNVNPDLIPGWAQLSIEISSVEPGIRKAVNEARVAEDERRLVNGRIVKRVKGGFRVSLTLGCNAFLPNSHLEGEPASDHWIGWEGPFKVLNVNPERFNVVVSRRDAAELETEKRRAEVFETLAPGQIRRGIVTNIVDYGAFVDLGGFTALLHQKGIRDGLGPAPGELFKKGQEIEIIVLTLDHERRRANLAYEPP